MIVAAGFLGFVLAWAIVGIIYWVKRRRSNQKPYKILVEIDGITFVMDTLLVDMIGKGMIDDYCDNRMIIINNIIQKCYQAMDEGWKEQHKELYARCGFLIESDSLTLNIVPLNISSEDL